MYAPWRMVYIKSEKPTGCVFCKDSIREDDLILLEGRSAFVMLNRYPYISGHLMVIPFRHVQQIEDLHPLEKAESMDLIDISVKSLISRPPILISNPPCKKRISLIRGNQGITLPLIHYSKSDPTIVPINNNM